jgi:hypothetical protein
MNDLASHWIDRIVLKDRQLTGRGAEIPKISQDFNVLLRFDMVKNTADEDEVELSRVIFEDKIVKQNHFDVAVGMFSFGNFNALG